MTRKKQAPEGRQSGIELYKIIAMFLIVLSHVTQSLRYLVDLSQATESIQLLILSWVTYSGAQGNMIFFVCSAWFLLDDHRQNPQKVFRILANVWVVNVIFLIVMMVFGDYSIDSQRIFRSLLPNTYALNWYISCYCLFYLIHEPLNRLILSLSQRQLLITSSVMFVLYYVLWLLSSYMLFSSDLIIFITAYFVIAYLKRYRPRYCNSVSKNIVGLLVGSLTPLLLTVLTNYLGLRMERFSDIVDRWGGNGSPFLFLAAVSGFLLFRKLKFSSRFLNRVSSLSLLTYILHENYLFRTYVRPQIWVFLAREFGSSDQILFLDLFYTVCLFAVALLVAWLYSVTLQPVVNKATDALTARLAPRANRLCDKIMQLQ